MEPTQTLPHLVLLEQLILMFFRGGLTPDTYQWVAKVTWYSEGGGNNCPGLPIAEWSGTDWFIDQLPVLIIRGGKYDMIWATMRMRVWLTVWSLSAANQP